MVDFIVLGQIPGTNFYVDFNYVAIGMAIIILTVCTYKLSSPFKHYKRRMQEIFDTAI